VIWKDPALGVRGFFVVSGGGARQLNVRRWSKNVEWSIYRIFGRYP
jgi:hypothetical protein